MQNQQHFSFRLLFLRVGCLLIASSIILLNTSIVSDASTAAGPTKTVNITYNDGDDAIWFGNTYLPDDIKFSEEPDYRQDITYFWYMGGKVKLFDSESDYYGYAVTVTRTSNTVNTHNAISHFWAVGTMDSLLSGGNIGGRVSSSSFTVWVETKNSVQAVHMAPFYQFISRDHWDDVNDMPETHDCGEYEINAKYTVKYTGYKTADSYSNAMNDIKTELEEQTGIQDDQLTELEEQTDIQNDQLTELEEQTENQKSFFGSFFDNLKESVIGLFVPSADEMADLFAQLDQFFEDKFGFLYYPFNILADFVSMMISETSEVSITLPSFSIMGYEVWPDMTYNFGQVTHLQTIASYVQIVTGSGIVFGFINYLRDYFDKRFGGGGK